LSVLKSCLVDPKSKICAIAPC